jgi:hypothetical protein
MLAMPTFYSTLSARADATINGVSRLIAVSLHCSTLSYLALLLAMFFRIQHMLSPFSSHAYNITVPEAVRVQMHLYLCRIDILNTTKVFRPQFLVQDLPNAQLVRSTRRIYIYA